MIKRPVIKNAAGDIIKLTEREARSAQWHEMVIQNSLGFEVDITTLTTVVKEVSEQKFYQIPVADFMPVKVGDGAFNQQLLTYLSFGMSGKFEEGIMNTGNENSRMATADAGVTPVYVPIINWGRKIGWNIFEIAQAAQSGSWDIVSEKERSRKENWDLGIQRISFLGADGMNGTDGTVKGLLNQSDVTVNTTVIPKAIKSMTPTELSTFLGAIIPAYRSNCNYTAWPSVFAVPEDDYTGLGSQSSPEFPIKSKLQVVEDTLKELTKNKNFKVLPLAYAQVANSNGVLSKPRYTLLNYDQRSLRIDVPVYYTTTLANTIEGFNFINAGYGQFTGAKAYRPLEMMYFEY